MTVHSWLFPRPPVIAGGSLASSTSQATDQEPAQGWFGTHCIDRLSRFDWTNFSDYFDRFG